MSRRTQVERREVRGSAAPSDVAVIGRKALGLVGLGRRFPPSIEGDAFPMRDLGSEPFPTSPFILEPYQQELPVLPALRPGWRDVGGDLVAGSGAYSATGSYPAGTWTVRSSMQFGPGFVPPGPGKGQQDALGDRPGNHAVDEPRWGVPNAGTHQLWTRGPGVTGLDVGLPDPLLFHVRLQVRPASFTTSPVVNIDSGGFARPLPPGARASAAGFTMFRGAEFPSYLLPPSTIYGYNGTFPGPLLNVEYGRPVLVRFENDLDLNPFYRDRQDFGAPDWAFLAHLHNGHTAPESDGQPHHLVDHGGGYEPTEWCDNLYLAHPAGGDDREKQSFLWLHDQRRHHAGAHLDKGMVGLAPHYDPVLDSGDETRGLRLPGIRVDHGDGSFDVRYDVSLALHDCRLDDGVASHRRDRGAALGSELGFPFDALRGSTHPEWWGQLFHGRDPDHRFLGDVFTVNGVAYPVMHVYRRKYRFRYLDASLSRPYVLELRKGEPHPFPGLPGQWSFGRADGDGSVSRDRGECVMLQMQIASDGGLLPTPIEREAVELWPAKRREVVIDFTRYRDGTPTAPGDVVYLTNTAFVRDGSHPGDDGRYAVPLVRIVIGGAPPERDCSVMPVAGKTLLREAPPADPDATEARDFTLQRGSGGGATEWLAGGHPVDPLRPVATPILGSGEAWAIANGAAGRRSVHLHMEEHRILWRSTDPRRHADDSGKEDVVALEPGEATVLYRRFRTFLGNYVAHCRDLAHEDRDLMFGWTVVKSR